MKRKPDGSRRLITAYLSVGETENYRYYWKPQWSKQRPAWIGKENKHQATTLSNIGDPFGRTSFLDHLTRSSTGSCGPGSMASTSIALTPTIILATRKSAASKCAISSFV
jgi:hypothetical protein